MKNIYLFHGEDSYTAHHKAQYWKQAFEEKNGDLNSNVFEGNEFSASMYSEAINTLPFLSDKKFILIKNAFAGCPIEELRKIAEQIEKTEDHCVVVFVERSKADSRTGLFKALKKHGQIMEFPAPDRNKLITWITGEMTKRGQQIAPKEAAYLADTIGPDLWQLNQEIEKISLNITPDSPLTTVMIDELTIPNAQVSIFKLTDHISQKNSRDSLSVLTRLISNGENLIPLMFLIASHLRNLIQITDCLNKKMVQGAIVKKTKIHPFAVSNCIRQCKNFTPKQLITMHSALLQIDNAIKSGKIKLAVDDQTELQLAIEKFIVKSCV